MRLALGILCLLQAKAFWCCDFLSLLPKMGCFIGNIWEDDPQNGSFNEKRSVTNDCFHKCCHIGCVWKWVGDDDESWWQRVASLPRGIAMRGGQGLCEPWADRKPGKGARSGLRISHFGTSGCSHLWEAEGAVCWIQRLIRFKHLPYCHARITRKHHTRRAASQFLILVSPRWRCARTALKLNKSSSAALQGLPGPHASQWAWWLCDWHPLSSTQPNSESEHSVALYNHTGHITCSVNVRYSDIAHVCTCHIAICMCQVRKSTKTIAGTYTQRETSTDQRRSRFILVGRWLKWSEVIWREARRDSVVSMAAHRKPTKKGRKLVVLECSEQRQMVRDGVPGAGGPRGGVSRYYTEKNVRNTPELLKLRKFNKYLGRHTLHVELKWELARPVLLKQSACAVYLSPGFGLAILGFYMFHVTISRTSWRWIMKIRKTLMIMKIMNLVLANISVQFSKRRQDGSLGKKSSCWGARSGKKVSDITMSWPEDG